MTQLSDDIEVMDIHDENETSSNSTNSTSRSTTPDDYDNSDVSNLIASGDCMRNEVDEDYIQTDTNTQKSAFSEREINYYQEVNKQIQEIGALFTNSNKTMMLILAKIEQIEKTQQDIFRLYAKLASKLEVQQDKKTNSDVIDEWDW